MNTLYIEHTSCEVKKYVMQNRYQLLPALLSTWQANKRDSSLRNRKHITYYPTKTGNNYGSFLYFLWRKCDLPSCLTRLALRFSFCLLVFLNCCISLCLKKIACFNKSLFPMRLKSISALPVKIAYQYFLFTLVQMYS